MEKDLKVFVLHVKKGYEERAAHIDSMMSRLGIEFEYFLAGDIPDLTPELLDKYFTGMMKATLPVTSCATKHLLCHEKIVADNLPCALIL
jgi:glycosyl transferase family 25